MRAVRWQSFDGLTACPTELLFWLTCQADHTFQRAGFLRFRQYEVAMAALGGLLECCAARIVRRDLPGFRQIEIPARRAHRVEDCGEIPSLAIVGHFEVVSIRIDHGV